MSNPINIGDPDAIERLQEKIAKLEKRQETMKAANKICRSKMHEDVKLQELQKLGLSEGAAYELLNPRYSYQKPGYESWQLSNNNQEIRRLQQRLQQAETAEKFESSETTNEEGVRIEWDADDNRVRLYFPETRVSNAMYNTLRRNGFVYARTLGAFSRMWTNSDAKYRVDTVLRAYKEEAAQCQCSQNPN
ncbi:MAG: hypothetical protein H6661_03125 [Ardenticatenaceae bacterium]|nr:hypothetical protein [Ardenticatenaceae bacterium]